MNASEFCFCPSTPMLVFRVHKYCKKLLDRSKTQNHLSCIIWHNSMTIFKMVLNHSETSGNFSKNWKWNNFSKIECTLKFLLPLLSGPYLSSQVEWLLLNLLKYLSEWSHKVYLCRNYILFVGLQGGQDRAKQVTSNFVIQTSN